VNEFTTAVGDAENVGIPQLLETLFQDGQPKLGRGSERERVHDQTQESTGPLQTIAHCHTYKLIQLVQCLPQNHKWFTTVHTVQFVVNGVVLHTAYITFLVGVVAVGLLGRGSSSQTSVGWDEVVSKPPSTPEVVLGWATSAYVYILHKHMMRVGTFTVQCHVGVGQALCLPQFVQVLHAEDNIDAFLFGKLV